VTIAGLLGNVKRIPEKYWTTVRNYFNRLATLITCRVVPLAPSATVSVCESNFIFIYNNFCVYKQQKPIVGSTFFLEPLA